MFRIVILMLVTLLSLNSYALVNRLFKDDVLTIGYRINQPEQRKIAKKICKLVEREYDSIGCDVEGFFSSEAITKKLHNGKIQLGLLRGNFAVRQSGLVSVVSLYEEYLTVLSKDGRIKTLSELKDTPVGVFAGVRGTIYDVINHEKGQNVELNLKTFELYDSAELALYNNEIYALILSTYHPNDKIYKLIKEGYKLNTVDSDAVNKMIKKYKYYYEADIPKDMYYTETPINTVGISIDMVASRDRNDRYVNIALTAIFKNFQEFKLSNKALLEFTPSKMFNRAVLPLHRESSAFLKNWKTGNFNNKKKSSKNNSKPKSSHQNKLKNNKPVLKKN